MDGFEYFACDADLPAVREVSAVWKRQAHNRIARLDQCQICGPIGNRAGVGLDVGVVGLEELFGTLPRHYLDKVGHLLAFIISPAGVTLGVFVGKTTSAGQHYGPGYIVLRGDKAN